MIWQYLNQKNITPQKAKEVFKLVKNQKNLKIKKAYAKIVDDEIRYTLACKKEKELLKLDDKCLNIAFSPYKTIKLTKAQREELLKKELNSTQKELLKIQNEPFDIKQYYSYKPNIILKFFLSLPKKTFKENFNKKLPKDFIQYLSTSSLFSTFIAKSVTNYELNQLHKSFFSINSDKLNYQTYFYLALNALRYDNKTSAMQYLKKSEQKAYKSYQKDRAVFWMYLITGDESYLNDLLLSMSINVYTIYAHEKMKVDILNYSDMIYIDKVSSNYDLQNPFDWFKIYTEIKNTPNSKLFEMVKKYKHQNLIPIQRFILEKAYNYKLHWYISPYDKYLNNLSIDYKSQIYAIMRQESNFIPSAISSSFALGLMQLMPFLIDHISKAKKENLKDYNEMFQPERNLKYSITHLNWLKKNLDNTLYIAYAYNGGLGFFTKYKKQDRFKKGKYEPFMSMEMMSNSQSREYGKKVLANYYMYKKIYNEPFSMIWFLRNLD